MRLRHEREGRGFSSIAYHFLNGLLKSGGIIVAVALQPFILRHSHPGWANSTSPYSPFSNTCLASLLPGAGVSASRCLNLLPQK
jgi:hypothetical protein